MDLGLISSLAIPTLALAIGIALFAGVVKGAIGFAMPLILVSGISQLVDPKLALGGIIVPVVVSNGLQALRKGLKPAIAAVKECWRYTLIVCVAIFLAAQLVPRIPSSTFFIVLGIPVVIISIIQLLGLRMTIPPKHRGWSEWVVGIIAGTLGGLAGTWGPATILYLLAINMPKAMQITVQGVVYSVGAITLLVAHLQSGIVNSFTAPFSFMLLPFALAGMWVGFQIQDRLDQELFRKITLIVLVIAGLNLLRRGFFG